LNRGLARILPKADALLDTRIPYLLSTTGQDVRQRIFDEMRGSDRLFVATSSNMVVYDSGSVPATERARVNRTADPL